MRATSKSRQGVQADRQGVKHHGSVLEAIDQPEQRRQRAQHLRCGIDGDAPQELAEPLLGPAEIEIIIRQVTVAQVAPVEHGDEGKKQRCGLQPASAVNRGRWPDGVWGGQLRRWVGESRASWASCDMTDLSYTRLAVGGRRP